MDFVEQALERGFGRKRTGRHPRSLLGQFKTELFKRVVRIENYELQEDLRERRKGWGQSGCDGIIGYVYRKYPEYGDTSVLKDRDAPIVRGKRKD